MIKEIISIEVMLVLCIPALAVNESPVNEYDLIGNWTGSNEGVTFSNITSSQNFTFREMGERTWTFIIEEQRGASFTGKKISSANPLPEKVLGIIGFDNKTIWMVDEDGYYWGEIISPIKMQLLHQETRNGEMKVFRGIFSRGIFTKKLL